MPSRIYQSGNRLGSFRVQLLYLPVHPCVCPAVHRAHVEHHPVRIAVAERMAVHAVVARLVVRYDRGLFESLQIALVEPHPVPCLVPGRYQAVGHEWIDLVGADVYDEGLEPLPSVVFPNAHLCPYVLTGRGKGAPFPDGDIEFGAFYTDDHIARRQDQGGFSRRSVTAEIKRCYIARDGHIGIIGKNGGPGVDFAGKLYSATAGPQENGQDGCQDNQRTFHRLVLTLMI